MLNEVEWYAVYCALLFRYHTLRKRLEEVGEGAKVEIRNSMTLTDSLIQRIGGRFGWLD
jgi:hypothetical protein